MNRIGRSGGALVAGALVFLVATAGAQTPLGTVFTYQGELRQNNIVVDQASDFVFDVFGLPAGGVSLGTNTRNAVAVVRGVFAVELDFGAGIFAGDERWLEIRVRTPAGAGGFTTLTPRVRLTAGPHAQFALRSALANDASALGGNAPGAYVLKGEVDSVNAAMIAANAVGTSEIADGSVGTADLANGAVTSAKIAPDAITNLELAPNSVTGANVVNGSIVNSDLAGSSVSSANIIDGTITAADLAAGAIDGGNAATVDGIDGAQFLRSDVSDVINGSIWTISAGSPNQFTLAGANLLLSLGDSAADQVSVNGVFSTNGTVTLGDAISDIATVSGDLNVGDQLNVAGATQLGNALTDTTTVSGDLDVVNFLTIGNILTYDRSGPKRFRFENGSGGLETNFSYEPALGAFDTASSLKVGPGTIWAGGSGGLISLPAFNALGSSKFPNANEVSNRDDAFITDDLALGGSLLLGTMSSGSVSSTIYFADPGFSTNLNNASHANSIGWVESTASGLASCTGPTGAITSAMVFDVSDGTASGWAFTNGADVEFVVDELGVVAADSTINALGGCDLAERFLGPDGLEPGTLLRIDPQVAEAVLPTKAAYDSTIVGVVSARPAFVMGGPTADALPVIDDMMETYRLLELNPNDADLNQRAADLERAVDTWQRGNVEVALVGRVPVKVVGPVKAGEPLTSSDVEGHAMAMTQAGPSVGIALESKASAGSGTVLVLIQPGMRAPLATPSAVTREAVGATAPRQAVDPAFVSSFEARLARLETELARGEDGRDGRDGLDGVGGLDGADGRSGASVGRDGARVVRLEKESWGDFDHDRLDDVLVLDPGAAAKLYRNLGDGRFADVTGTAGLGDTTGATNALWQDVDQDARLDLLLVGKDGAARLLRGNGAGQFADVTAALGLDFGKPIVGVEWLDHDHDGRPDLRVELADGTLLLHHNLGGLVFESVQLRPSAPAAAATGDHARVVELEARLAKMEALLETMAKTLGADR